MELGGGRDHLDELLLAEVLKTTAGEGDGDLEAVRDDGGSDDLVLGDFSLELGDGGLVEENGVGELLTSLTLGPLLLLGVGTRTGHGSLSLLFLSLLDLRGHVLVFGRERSFLFFCWRKEKVFSWCNKNTLAFDFIIYFLGFF